MSDSDDPSNLEFTPEFQSEILPVIPSSITTLHQSPTSCTCIVYFKEPQPIYDDALTVAVTIILDADNWAKRTRRRQQDEFISAAGLQQLGHYASPNHVPKLFKYGKIEIDAPDHLRAYFKHKWTTHHYTITQHIDGVMLDGVWDNITDRNRAELMDSLVPVIESFYRIKIHDEKTIEQHGPIYDNLIEKARPMDHPYWSAYDIDPPNMLYNDLELTFRNPNLHHHLFSSNRRIWATGPDQASMPTINISDTIIAEMERNAVLSFMDFEPRNILVRPHPDPKRQGEYEFVSLMNWKCACFRPLGYEIFYKDTQLGFRSFRPIGYDIWYQDIEPGFTNINYSFYNLFRTKTQHLIDPPEPYQETLFRVFDMCRRTYGAMTGEEEGMEKKKSELMFRKSWIEQEKLEHRGLKLGWVKRGDNESLGKTSE